MQRHRTRLGCIIDARGDVRPHVQIVALDQERSCEQRLLLQRELPPCRANDLRLHLLAVVGAATSRLHEATYSSSSLGVGRVRHCSHTALCAHHH